MKLNYKAIGMRLQFLCKRTNITDNMLCDFLGNTHQFKIGSYFSGENLTEEITDIICGFIKKKNPHRWMETEPRRIKEFGFIKKLPNVLSLHIQYGINRRGNYNYQIGKICEELEITRESLKHWASGKHVPKKDKAYNISLFLEISIYDAESLIQNSRL